VTLRNSEAGFHFRKIVLLGALQPQNLNFGLDSSLEFSLFGLKVISLLKIEPRPPERLK
jgi:hypothetical protein